MLYLPCLAGSTQVARSERRRSQGRREGRDGAATAQPELPAAVRQRGGGGGAGKGQYPGLSVGCGGGGESMRRRSCQPRPVFRGGSSVPYGEGEEELVPAKFSVEGRIQGSLAVMAAGEAGGKAVKKRKLKNQDTSTIDL